jgi:stearoyl-CoA desaturase (delta-9 desaturase)
MARTWVLLLFFGAHWEASSSRLLTVAWCAGYTLVVDVLTMGELFQNNHHAFASSPNFAARAFEIDPGYFVVIRVLAWAGVIALSGAQRATAPPRVGSRAAASTAFVALPTASRPPIPR